MCCAARSQATRSIRTSEPLDSRRLKGGESFQATVAQDLFAGQYLAVPRGAVLQGYVVGVKKPGAPLPAIKLGSLSLSQSVINLAKARFAAGEGSGVRRIPRQL